MSNIVAITTAPAPAATGGAAATTGMFEDYPDLLTIRQVQEALQISRSKAYRLIHEGYIGHMRIKNDIRIPKRFLLDYVGINCYNVDVASDLSRCAKGE